MNRWKYVFVCIYICIFILVNFTFFFNPIKKENINPFLSLAILGSDLKSSNYYPDDNPTINLGVKMNWNIYVYNGMGKSEYVVVKVKILSSKQNSPNSTLCMPSTEPSVYEISKIIKFNETWIEPFTWSVDSINSSDENIDVIKIQINNNILKVNIYDNSDQTYKIVFELWVYDESIEDFTFDLSSFSISRCLWNQLYFKIFR